MRRACQLHRMAEVAEEAAEIVAEVVAAVRTAAARTVAEAGAKGRCYFPSDRTTASLWMPLLFVLRSPP